MATTLTAEQRIQRSHVWLMNNPKYCLYAGVFMMGSVEVLEDFPTAGTNGRDVKYGRKFVEKLTEQELRGLILHENLHKAFRHMSLWKHLDKESPMLTNMAMDYVINLMIHDSDPEGKDVKLPEGGCFDEKFRGMDTGEVYRLLKQESEKNGKGKGNGQASGDGEAGSGEGFDEHDFEGARELTAEEQQELDKEIDQALRQGALLAGKMKGNVPREISELLEAKVDWRDVMREFVSGFCMDKDISTWRKPNRRWVDQDVYLPSLIGETVGRIVIAIDMSGSIGDREVGEFLGNVKAICETVSPEGIDLIYWDTDVCQHEKYEQGEYEGLLQSTKPRGGGGTSPQCVATYVNKKKIKAECILILTDGYVDSWGKDWSAPVLWGITTKGITADTGVSVYVRD